MSVIRIKDIAHVRFSAPDLDAMEAFLCEFGLVRAERHGGTLFMRGTGSSPFLHATQRGEAGFAFTFRFLMMASWFALFWVPRRPEPCAGRPRSASRLARVFATKSIGRCFIL